MQKQTGFTLIEVLVVVAIIAILAAIAYPSYIDYIRKGRLEDARATVVDNIKMMERYYGAARTFECKDSYAKNVGVTCISATSFTPDTTSNKKANDFYDFTITSVNNNSNYIIKATPKSSAYNSDVLAKQQLHLLYHSGSASYAKCTTAGASAFAGTATSNDGCSAL